MMNEIVSFSKEIDFNNMLNKITSISLEHTLMIENSSIKGDLIVSGSYIQTIASQIETPFSYKIPVEIELDQKYDLSNVTIDIDDFTYEIIDEKKLKVNIDLLIDKLEIKKDNEPIEQLDDELVSVNDLFKETDEEKKLDIPLTNDIEEKKEDKIDNSNIQDNNDKQEEKDKDDEKQESLFSNLTSTNESYTTYKIYIVKEEDTLEKILEKYSISKPQLEEYNDLTNISKGTKLIIPNNND